MSRTRTIELKWTCGECSTSGILGRHKRCPSCGSPREKGEMNMSGLGRESYDNKGYNAAVSVTDPELLKLAKAGADWFCTHCEAGNVGDGNRCDACGGPRYGEPEENHPKFDWTRPPPTIHTDPNVHLDQRRVYSVAAPKLHATSLLSDADDDDDPEDWREEWSRVRLHRNQKIAGVVASILLLLGLFIFWALQTHDAEGSVSLMRWEQNTIVQRWTDIVVREWRDSTREVSEVRPVNGSGERAGMTLLGDCRQEHHHDERYVCGSHRECHPTYRTESYQCGESCRDNGNGFATCTPRTCTRQVQSGESCSNVDDYCNRPIYKTKCDYRTQEWRTAQTLPASGLGNDTRWPVAQPGELERLRYSADYTVTVSYEDRGSPQRHEFKPADTLVPILGSEKILTLSAAQSAERAFRGWSPNEPVVLRVNNLGGVSDVLHLSEVER